jgi:hypothetical protein
VLLHQGELAFDGPTGDAIAAYRRLLADDAAPDELEAGLKEWGSGEARIVSAELLDDDGDARAQFLGGEPLTVRLRVASERGLAAPRLTLELRDDDGVVLGAVAHDLGRSGWNGAGEHDVRFRLDRLPLADGRFHLRFALTDPQTGTLLHTLDDAARFFVFPGGEATGAVLLDGAWSVEENRAGAPIPRT